ncbi:MAG: hypothetical protein PHU85_14030 [Phycisphaerae bacterium]|nr:hypothetical protein [Phycisphaerae bacterium]
MAKTTTTCDLMIIGGGVCAAATAFAAASLPVVKRRKPPTIGLVLTDPRHAGDIVAASYAFLNPAVTTLLPALKPRLAKLTDGSFRGLSVMTAGDGRQAEFSNRGVSGYLCDGPKLLKGLLALCRDAGVQIVRTAGTPRFAADDHAVHAVWPGGQCDSRLALLTDPETILSDQADGLGFRHQWMTGRLFPCFGQTFAASPARLNELFGKSRRIVTVWQLNTLSGELGELTSPTGHDGHAWIMPRTNSVAVGLLAGKPTNGRSSLDPADVMAAALTELRAINALPREVNQPVSPVQTWQMPVATALELESHVGKRSLATGLAGGFVSALSGQWLYPVFHAGLVAAAVAEKALADARPQDVISQFGARWRSKLSDCLRSPNTRLAFLLPLVFGNRQIADRFSRAYLFGENF